LQGGVAEAQTVAALVDGSNFVVWCTAQVDEVSLETFDQGVLARAVMYDIWQAYN
jgi:hypothetical protein